MKVGTVLILGKPNVGKSTLLNSLVKRDIAIVSEKVGTTRNLITGIYEDENSEILFLDTPGVGKTFDLMGKNLNKVSLSYLNQVDLILLVVDIKSGFKDQDQFLLKTLNQDIPTFLVINKIDGESRETILKTINSYKDLYDFKEIIPVSSLKERNIEELLKTIKKYLPEGEKRYANEVTFNKLSFQISEIIRGEILRETYQEVPHQVTCKTVSIINDKETLKITVIIIIERENVKKIIIGKDGEKILRIKKYGTKKISELINKKIALELKFLTVENWRNDKNKMKELGFNFED